MAEQVQETILDGIFIKGVVAVQCARCLEQGRQTELISEVTNSNLNDPENVDEFLVVCKVCSQELGQVAGVPFSVIVGAQLAEGEAAEAEGA